MFRLGIRAYDINHPDGAFVMVDNIFYEAEFCKVASEYSCLSSFDIFSVDFGSDFHPAPLITDAQGMPINSATQLACDSFDQKCRWRNGGYSGAVPWMKAMQKITGPFIELFTSPVFRNNAVQ